MVVHIVDKMYHSPHGFCHGSALRAHCQQMDFMAWHNVHKDSTHTGRVRAPTSGTNCAEVLFDKERAHASGEHA